MKDRLFKPLFLITILFIVSSCSPKTSNLSGDVFLKMKNGTIKPVAAGEIYLFPIETDFDSSFVMPLKTFINSAKYNVAKKEVEDLCSAMDKEIPSVIKQSSSDIASYYQNNQFSQDIELTCDALSVNIDSVKLEIETATKNAKQQSQPIQEQMSKEEQKAQLIRKELDKIALDQGTILKNEQVSKVKLYSGYKGPDNIYDSLPDYINLEYFFLNQSVYIIKEVKLGPYIWKGKPLSTSERDPDIIKKCDYTFSYSGGCSEKIIYGGSEVNPYGERIPGLSVGSSSSKTSDSFVLYRRWPTDRWLDENIKDFKTRDHRLVENFYCGQYTFSDPCVIHNAYSVDVGKRSIIDINFGMPHVVTTNANNKTRTYTTEDVDWVGMGRNTNAYKSSSLHNELKLVQIEIKDLENQVKEIEKTFSIDENTAKLDETEKEFGNCNLAKDLRDTEIEIQQCLTLIDDQDGLTALLSNSSSTFGENIANIFNSISEEDLGYSSFEELLNAFAKSRNALVSISSIQGAYSFTDVPLGKYVIFTSYEDRFNGVGHWFEELDFQEETKLDLNNLNYKESGVYSYLRDKLGQ
jgi:hypothetical protein